MMPKNPWIAVTRVSGESIAYLLLIQSIYTLLASYDVH